MIQSSEHAADIITGLLANQKIRVERVHTHRNTNGTHVNLIDKNSNVTYHVKFANEPFHSFGYYFKEYAGEKGETLDSRVINELKDDDILLFAYPDRILKCTVAEFCKPMLVRTNNKGTQTWSFPIVNLESLFYIRSLESEVEI